MGSGTGDGFSLTELFVVKFVLADIVIIAALLFAGPIYAVAITALLVVSVFLVWYLTQHVDGRDEPGQNRPEWTEQESSDAKSHAADPVTTLQQRYAAGELSEAEFEAGLDRLIEANERADAAGVETAELSLERTK